VSVYQLLPRGVVYIFNRVGNLGIGTSCRGSTGIKKDFESRQASTAAQATPPNIEERLSEWSTSLTS
jgi:hypothetical protein